MLNEDGLTVRVLHVDSRTRISGRAEDCEIQLPESINLPSGAVTWCTSASVPLAWPNVSTLNNKLYVTEYVDGLGLDPFVDGVGECSYPQPPQRCCMARGTGPGTDPMTPPRAR